MTGGRYICYDYLQVAGGAERLALLLAQELGWPLVISRRFAEVEPLLNTYHAEIRELGCPLSVRLRRVPEALWCHLQRTRFLRDAECVVYSGLYAPLASRHQRYGKKYYYCHTLPRFAYDRNAAYRCRIPALLRPAFDLFVTCYRHQFIRAIRSMDAVITNSQTVQQRLKTQASIDAQVIYPPVETDRFQWLADEGYFLSLARLTPIKKVELIVQAFLQMPDQQLVVASGGPELEKLKTLANGATNIRFTGWQSEDELRETIGRARAAIYIAEDEDFGMSPVEAMAAGKPVIGVAEGGLCETILHEKTGILLPPGAVTDALVDAVRRMNAATASSMREACVARARQFNAVSFTTQMRTLLTGKAT